MVADFPVRFELAHAMDIADVQEAWQELEVHAAPHFFLTWNWIGCWLAETSLRPLMLIGRAGDRIVLLGALIPTTRRDVLPIAIHGLQLHTTGDMDRDVITIEYNGFLVDLTWAGEIEANAIAFLLNGIHRCVELHLRNVPASLDSAAHASGFAVRELQRKPSWRIDLAAIRASGTPYLASLSANTRQQIRRSMRLYEVHGPLTARAAEGLAEGMAFLDGLKELHQRQWTRRGEPGAFAYPFFESFQHRLIESCLPQGTVEIVRVAAGPLVIGYIYNLIYNGHVSVYQTGFLYEADPRRKPGLVSHALCIQGHLDAGSDVYDFMAGEARYKANLGQPGPEMVYLLAQRSTWSIRLENTLRDVRRRLVRRQDA
ncbi:MAG TPA: GNAT family N-acetyltransferase [Acetobacteraceae bacterium]|nr:GNAT family N-acetyltransferase [Acetobacteraceae bacterium]